MPKSTNREQASRSHVTSVPDASASHALTIANLQRTNERLQLISRITSLVVGTASLAEQWRELAGQVRTVFEAEACVIRALEGDQLRLIACNGVTAGQLPATITSGWGISGQIVHSRLPLLIDDTRQHAATIGIAERLPNSYTFRAYAGAPLLVEDRVVGILGIYSQQPGAFHAEDAEHLRLVAYHIAVALANDSLYRQVIQQKEQLEWENARRQEAERAQQQSMIHLRDSLEGTVRAMSSVVEMRDPYTAGHQRRVAALACAIAAQMGISPHTIKALHIAGLLHDVGKIVVPAEILCKPGRLSPPEWSIIQTHAQTGYELLRGTALPEEVALVALHHHERLDGSGYPQGLRSADIHPLAQILAVADVVEAMVSDRPYRPGLPMQTALAEILEHQGMRYQRNAVEACFEVLAKHEYDLEPIVK